MSTSERGKKQEQTPLPWPHPTNLPPPGGEWDPPEGIKDVALLLPSTTGNPGVHMAKDYPVFYIAGLDGKYLLSSDGSTRPYGEGH